MGGTAVATTYTFTELAPTGSGESYAYSMNNRGNVVGYGDGNMPTLWKSDKARDLATIDSMSGIAEDINDAGQMIGTISIRDVPGGYRPVFWETAIGEPIALPTLGGMSAFVNSGLAENGDCVGSSQIEGDAGYHATWWHAGQPVDLGTLGGTTSYGYEINRRGHIVGYSQTEGNWTVAPFLWKGGVMHKLKSLGGLNAHAYSVNDHDQIVGDSDTKRSLWFATLWEGGKPIALGNLPGTEFSTAASINKDGVVVGYSRVGTGDVATVWTDRVPTNLNDVVDPAAKAAGWILQYAVAVNEHGLIAGNGYNTQTGLHRGFLLRPVSLAATD